MHFAFAMANKSRFGNGDWPEDLCQIVWRLLKSHGCGYLVCLPSRLSMECGEISPRGDFAHGTPEPERRLQPAGNDGTWPEILPPEGGVPRRVHGEGSRIGGQHKTVGSIRPAQPYQIMRSLRRG